MLTLDEAVALVKTEWPNAFLLARQAGWELWASPAEGDRIATAQTPEEAWRRGAECVKNARDLR